MNLRDWGWFIIIQKTRPPIGQPDPNQELIDLENKCNAAYGAYTEALETTKRMQEEMKTIEEEGKGVHRAIGN